MDRGFQWPVSKFLVGTRHTVQSTEGMVKVQQYSTWFLESRAGSWGGIARGGSGLRSGLQIIRETEIENVKVDGAGETKEAMWREMRYEQGLHWWITYFKIGHKKAR